MFWYLPYITVHAKKINPYINHILTFLTCILFQKDVRTSFAIQLPPEIWFMILNLLPLIDLLNKRLTCRRFDDFVRFKIDHHSIKIWKRISEYKINYESELLRCVSGDRYVSSNESVFDHRHISDDNE